MGLHGVIDIRLTDGHAHAADRNAVFPKPLRDMFVIEECLDSFGFQKGAEQVRFLRSGKCGDGGQGVGKSDAGHQLLAEAEALAAEAAAMAAAAAAACCAWIASAMASWPGLPLVARMARP